MEEIAVYAHTCAKCVYLGRFERHDLYYCNQGNRPTVLARFGNASHEYISGMGLISVDDKLREAHERAILKGLILKGGESE